jgi:DNA-binding MarR family transcriptional regulator
MGARTAVAPPDLSGLSPEHERMLCEESAISPEVVAARVYYTATRPSEVPEAFSSRQRRRVGLVIPLYSPDGETVSYQLRPNYPISTSRKYENPHGGKVIADVHPMMRDKIKDVREPVFFTEGSKTADALTSQGMCTVMLSGVWNFAKPGTRCKELLSCLDHVPLNGRAVFIGYDADSRTNPQVQNALSRFAARLEERGASVRVIYPPIVNGDPKTGIDDYLASGGNLHELIQSARPFEPVNIREERLSKDAKLRRKIEALWEAWSDMPTTTQGQCTDRTTMRELIKIAEQRGKTMPDGIEVSQSIRSLAEGASIGHQGLANSLKRLREKGYTRKAPGPRDKKEAQAYILLGGRALSGHSRERTQSEQGGRTPEGVEDSLMYGNSSASVQSVRGVDAGVPELRSSKVVHQRERTESPNGSQSRWRVVDSYVIARLGKRRGEILRYLVKAGGSASIPDLVERFGTAAQKKRPRDFKRRQLPPLQGFRTQKTKKMQQVDEETWEEVEVDRVDLGPPIVDIDGDIVRLTPEWRENLEEVRTAAEEQEDARLQAERYALQRESFHSPKKAAAEPTPEMPDRLRIRRIVSASAERDEAARIEEQHRNVGVTAEIFIKGKLLELERVRLNLLREVWQNEGGDPSHILSAAYHLGCSIERLPEYGNELFVFPARPKRAERADRELPATVIDLLVRQKPAEVAKVKRTAAKLPKKVNGVFAHGPLCECDWCEDEPSPRYARAGGLARVREAV